MTKKETIEDLIELVDAAGIRLPDFSILEQEDQECPGLWWRENNPWNLHIDKYSFEKLDNGIQTIAFLIGIRALKEKGALREALELSGNFSEDFLDSLGDI
jgi:hypothetical protein